MQPANHMRVTILGSGTGIPTLNRRPCAVLVQTEGQNLLLDCGPGILHRLLRTGLAPWDLDAIVLSHFHPDHSSELVSFLFAIQHGDADRRSHPLALVAGNGLDDFFAALKAAYGEWMELAPGRLVRRQLDPGRGDTVDIGPVRLTTGRVIHRPESAAYRIENSSATSMVYSGDTDYGSDLIALARDTDLFICESSFPDEHKLPGHLTPRLAGDIARQAHVRHLMLTHFYPLCDRIDMARQCRSTFGGPLTLAADMMTIDLPSDGTHPSSPCAGRTPE